MEQKSLTPRQAEFLAKSAKGMSYKEIAKDCFVSINTVESTFLNARKRLEVKTNLQCFSVAISREELGLDHDGVCFVPDNKGY